MDFKKDNENGRDVPKRREKPFDYDAVQEDDLDDRITNALNGRDLLEPDAFGSGVYEYVPKRSADGRGKHEAPEPEGFVEETARRKETVTGVREETRPVKEKARPDPTNPRYAAPERPRVVVQEPPKVYVTPPMESDDRLYEESFETEQRGKGEGAKWLIAALVSLAVIGAVAAVFLRGPLRSTISGFIHREAASVTAEDKPRTESDIWSEPKKAEPEKTPEPAQAAEHMITVTAGSGGSISPSGIVAVKDNESQTFYITPDDGYELTQLIVDGAGTDLSSEYTFREVTGDHTIYAVFQQVWEPEPEAEIAPAIVTAPEPEQEQEQEQETGEEDGFVSGLIPESPEEPEPYYEPEVEYEPEQGVWGEDG